MHCRSRIFPVCIFLGTLMLAYPALAATTKPKPKPKPAPKFVLPDIPKPKPIPSGPNARTSKQFVEQVRKFYDRTILEAYKTHGTHDPKWDDAALKFLGQYIELLMEEPKETKVAEIRKQGAAVVDLGCSDPLVLSCQGMLLMSDGKFSTAKSMFERSMTGFQQSKYPKCRVYSVPRNLSEALTELKDPAAADKKKEYQDQAAALFAESFRDGSYLPGEQRIALYTYERALSRFMADRWRDAYAGWKKAPGVDPYVINVIAATYCIQDGWKARGGGWAYQVTEEGWKVFDKNLSEAADLLVPAWKAHPDYPEAPTEMIRVAMAGHGGNLDTPRLWFDRAVAAQLDYLQAYDNLLFALRPVWGGSWDEMYALGVEAAKTKRFDTNVPWLFATTLKFITSDSLDDKYWKKPETGALLDTIFDGYIAASDDPEKKNAWMNYKAAGAWRAGRYAEARKLMQELGDKVSPKVFLDFGGSVDKVRREVLLYGTQCSDDMQAAQQLYEKRDMAAAIKAYRAIGEKCKDDKEVAEYSDRQIKGAETYALLAKGEWLPLQPPADLSGWKVDGGNWAVADGGTVTATTKSGVWTSQLISEGDFGTRFEITGRIEFLKALKTSETPRQEAGEIQEEVGGGISLRTSSSKLITVLFYPGGGEARITYGFSGGNFGQGMATDLLNAFPFTITMWDGEVNVRFDNKYREAAFGKEMEDQKAWWTVTGIGIAVNKWGDFDEVRFSNLKIRQLTDRPSEP